MKALIVMLMLPTLACGQQSNQSGASFWLEFFNSVPPCNLPGECNCAPWQWPNPIPCPGPYQWQIPPVSGTMRMWVSGRSAQQFWLYVQPGPPTTGFAAIAGAGIVDIDPGASTPWITNVFPGSWQPCPSPPYCNNGGIGWPFSWPVIPPGLISTTMQMVAVDPVSPVGFSLSCAIQAVN